MLQAEELRAEFSDWLCVNNDMHKTFHSRLPSIP